MPTIFQIYTSSADAPPGKGVGESLAAGAEFKELRAVAGWRRILAASDQVVAAGTPAADILRLTGDAEIWYAKPRAAKVRWTVLEGLRESLAKQKAPEVTTDMEAPPKKVRAKKSGGATAGPEGAGNAAATATAVQRRQAVLGVQRCPGQLGRQAGGHAAEQSSAVQW